MVPIYIFFFWPQTGNPEPEEGNAGKTRSAETKPVSDSKVNKSGEVIWQQFTDIFDEPRSVVVDENNNAFVVGMTHGTPDTGWEAVIRMHRPDAMPLWTRSFKIAGGHSTLEDVAIGPNGSIYAVGMVESQGHDFISRFDLTGNQYWTRELSGNEAPRIRKVAVSSHGDIYAVGTSHRRDMSFDAILRKYNSKGKVVWTNQQRPSDSQASQASDLAIDLKGAIYTIMVDDAHSGERSSSFIRKYNRNEKIYWTRQVGTDTPFEFMGELIAVDKHGDIIVAGYNGKDWNEAQVIKYSRDGARLWIKLIGDSTIKDIAVDKEANIYVVGKTAGFEGQEHVGEKAFARKYNSDGMLLWKYSSKEEGTMTGVGIGKDDDLHVTGYEYRKAMPAFLARFRR